MPLDHASGLIRDELLRRIAYYDQELVALDAQLHGLTEQFPETTALRELHGIGPYSALLIVAEIGENIRAGQPVLAIEETGRRWLSFNAREDLLRGLAVGAKVDVAWLGARGSTPAVITEIMPLGSFATWQAERAVGDHDRSTLRLRLDPRGDPAGWSPA